MDRIQLLTKYGPDPDPAFDNGLDPAPGFEKGQDPDPEKKNALNECVSFIIFR
jgi:hypothetical protein